jgi:SPX domain protein involved in polyphosphate accumulation
MRFGKTLKAAIYPPWDGKYIDYAKLKGLLRERDLQGDDSDSETQPWTETDEESFVQELINVQLDKVNAFQSETSQQLRERTNACEAKLMPLARGADGQEITDDKKKQIAEEVVQELDSITKEVSELEKYSRINFSGFLKAAKKHDRKRGARYRIRPLLQVRLSELSFNSEDYSPLLHRLSAMYTFTRQVLGIELPADDEPTESRPVHDAYVSYKFWVHTDNVVEVKTHILRRLPVLLYNPTTSKELDVSQRDPTITSLYFDNSSFDLYNQKVTRSSEAESLRLRWSGDLNESPAIFLEKKTALEDDRSRETRVQLKAKHVQEFLNGEYKFEKKVTRLLEGRAQGGSQEAEALKKEVEELQSFIKEHELQPMLRANYTRTAFQIPGDDRIRISLDTDLALIREDSLDSERPCRDPEDWHRRDIDELAMEYPFSSIHKGEISRFPHALLEIKLRNGARNIEWLHDLMVSHLVKEAPRFSKFVHGVAQLFEDNINTLPFWLGELENDIRQDPQTAFQHEQERLAQRAEEDLVVGSFLGSKSSPLQAMIGAGRGSPGRLAGTSPVIERRSSRPSMGRDVQAMKPSPAAEAIISSQPAPQPEAEPEATSSYLGTLFPSFSKSRYAQAHRPATAAAVALPAGVSAPDVWIKDTGPVRVESKVWLANQRTFIKWQHVSVLLASLSLALYNAADINNIVAQALAIIYTAFAVFASLWGWYIYEKRARLIRMRSGKDLDNLLGPVVVCVGLAAALVLNFGFKVSLLSTKKRIGFIDKF